MVAASANPAPLPHFTDRQGLSGSFVESQRHQESEGGKKPDTEPPQQDHQHAAQGRLHGKGEPLHQGHPGRPLEHTAFARLVVAVVVPRQAHGNKRNVEKMIGNGLNRRGFQVQQSRVHEHQAHQATDETTGHQKMLEESHPGAQSDAGQQKGRQKGEDQHAVKRKRRIHRVFLIDQLSDGLRIRSGLRKHIIDKSGKHLFPDRGRQRIQNPVDVRHAIRQDAICNAGRRHHIDDVRIGKA
jgi:hypothetical protein